MGMLIIRLIVTPIAVLSGFLDIVTFLILWDRRVLEKEDLMDIIWNRRN